MKPRNTKIGQAVLFLFGPSGCDGIPWAVANASPISAVDGSTLDIFKKYMILQKNGRIFSILTRKKWFCLLCSIYFLYSHVIPRNIANVDQNCAKTPRNLPKLAATPRIARNELVIAKNVESSMAAILPIALTSDSIL